MSETDVGIVRLDETNIKRCSEFFFRARGLKSECILAKEEYLRWKYLNPLTPDNICLILEKEEKIYAVVGGIVWGYVIDGREFKVCFPVDWYSSLDNPIKGAGRKVLRLLIEMFPASVGVGGSKICFEPQIKIGFKDVGDVFILGIDLRAPRSLREAARRAKHSINNPLNFAASFFATKKFWRENKPVFSLAKIEEEELFSFPASQFLSNGIPRQELIRRWQHYLAQPCNSSQILTIKMKDEVSYLLVCEFTDVRRSSYGLADALVNPAHSMQDILWAFRRYVDLAGGWDALFMTNNPLIYLKSQAIGYYIKERIRTQYFSMPNGPRCVGIEKFPSVSFLSSDEMCYRYGPEDILKKCNP